MKSVTIEELREKLDDVIDEVRSGETVTITSEGEEVARLDAPAQKGVPFPFRDLKLTPIGKDLSDLALQMLIEDRESDR